MKKKSNKLLLLTWAPKVNDHARRMQQAEPRAEGSKPSGSTLKKG